MRDMAAATQLREPLGQLVRDPTDFAHDLEFPAADRIRISDDTLRDGEQMPGVAFSPAVKYEIARMLSDVGVHFMLVGFPAVAPSECETLRLVLEGKRRGELREDLEIGCLNRANPGDIETAMRVVEEMDLPVEAITYVVFTSASDLHVKYKLGRSLLQREGLPEERWLELPVTWYRDANVRLLCDAIRYARERGARTVEFGAEDGSRADLDYLAALHRAGGAAGGCRALLTDTVGCYAPDAVRAHVAHLRAAAPDLKLGLHFHNDLGIGAWNTVIGLGSGADLFMTSVNGIGERAGNAPMHQVLLQLRYLFGIELPGLRYDRLRDLARLTERVSGIPVPPTEPGIGRNVFSHESGIHTAGMLIHPATYQFIPPEDLGAQISYVYGKHSGALVIEHALASAGLDCSPELVAAVMAEVKRIREERARRGDFAAFQALYDRHLEALGVTPGEVVELGRALSAGRLGSATANRA